jgi:DNA-binding MarR family transcriptional regulator
MELNKQTKNSSERLAFLVPEVLKSMHKNAKLHALNLPLPQLKILHALGHLGTLNMKKLSEHLGLEMSSVTVAIDALVESKLAERDRDAKDRRQVLVSMSAKGIEMHKKLKKLHMEHFSKLMSKLSLNKQKIVIDSFENLYKILKEEE